jgi:hypothetical protein
MLIRKNQQLWQKLAAHKLREDMAEFVANWCRFLGEIELHILRAMSGYSYLFTNNASFRICFRVVLPFVVLKYFSLRSTSDFAVWPS